MDATQFARIHNVWRRLGIPSDYAEARRLAFHADAVELVPARELPNGRKILLAPGAAAAWLEMSAQAAAEGITLLLVSGFRSFERQTEILEKRLAGGEPIEAILEVNAAPGCSEHHTGRAVDIGTPGCPPLTEGFETTPAHAWLARQGAEFGFQLSYPRDNPHGIVYEPWHWLWTPPS